MTEPAAYRVAQVAERWQVSPQKVRNMIHSGELQAMRFGRTIRIPVAEVERCEQLSIEGGEAPSVPEAAEHGDVLSVSAVGKKIVRLPSRRPSATQPGGPTKR